jgi:hypothetical protein
MPLIVSTIRILFLILCLCQVASAEIYECNGKWTNKPCDGEIGRSLEEIERPEPSVSTRPEIVGTPPEPLAPRYSLIRKLKKLRNEYTGRGMPSLSSTEIDGFESLCLDRSRPFVDCQSAFDAHATRLRDLELAREANDLAAERNVIEQQKADGYRRR